MSEVVSSDRAFPNNLCRYAEAHRVSFKRMMNVPEAAADGLLWFDEVKTEHLLPGALSDAVKIAFELCVGVRRLLTPTEWHPLQRSVVRRLRAGRSPQHQATAQRQRLIPAS